MAAQAGNYRSSFTRQMKRMCTLYLMFAAGVAQHTVDIFGHTISGGTGDNTRGRSTDSYAGGLSSHTTSTGKVYDLSGKLVGGDSSDNGAPVAAAGAVALRAPESPPA